MLFTEVDNKPKTHQFLNLLIEHINFWSSEWISLEQGFSLVGQQIRMRQRKFESSSKRMVGWNNEQQGLSCLGNEINVENVKGREAEDFNTVKQQIL